MLGQTMDDKSRGKAKQTEDWIKLLVCSILRCLSPLLSIQPRISLDIIFRLVAHGIAVKKNGSVPRTSERRFL